MGSLNTTFVLATILFFSGIFIPARLIAIRLKHDPILKMYKPDSIEYKAIVKFSANKRKVNLLLLLSLVAEFLLAVYIIHETFILINSKTPATRQTLIFTPIATLFVVIVGVVCAYNLLFKNLTDK
jgi:hypothetical protein